jgi:SAM-dependent methyltransferase
MGVIESYSQALIATEMRWLIDDIELDAKTGEIKIRGWIASIVDDFVNIKILFNGVPAEDLTLRVSPDLGEFYPGLGADLFRRFIAAHRQRELALDDGLLQFTLISGIGETPRNYRNSWFYPAAIGTVAMPESRRIRRVIGSGSWQSYVLGGTTIVRRLDLYLKERFGKGIGEFQRVLDWGCGSARLTRHLMALNPATWGADIDGDNVAWCNANIREGNFRQVNLRPPTSFAAAEFDLATGVSVFTHLDEADQFLWLEELARITRPGAILLMSVRGFSNLAYERRDPEIGRRLARDHFVVLGTNSDLRGSVDDESYYKDVLHAPDYIFAKWSRYFEIIDIIPFLAAPQDVVVMRKR